MKFTKYSGLGAPFGRSLFWLTKPLAMAMQAPKMATAGFETISVAINKYANISRAAENAI